MSRSNRTEGVKNPGKISLEWAGGAGDGFLKYWDKENKIDVQVPEIHFAVLDERSCVRGWMEEFKSNAYSNEVASLKNQNLAVKYFDAGKPREVVEGKYADIKDGLVARGVKYHKVIYAMLTQEIEGVDAGVIVKILLKGAAASAWMNITFKPFDGEVFIRSSAKGQKGAVKFEVPVFEFGEISEENATLAMDSDRYLQEYFKQVPHTAVHTDEPNQAVLDDANEGLVPADEDTIPF
jgi:hypothetical protein